MSTISEKTTEFREKAKELNLNISFFDDEDLIIFGIQYLIDNAEDIFSDDGLGEIDIREDDDGQCLDCLNTYDECTCDNKESEL